MRIQQPILRIVCLGLAFAFPAAGLADTTIYLVRHAEKSDNDKMDPDLSEAGQKRAESLAQVLRSAGIDQCIATQFKRTQATVQPTANAAGGKVLVHKAGAEKQLAEKLRQEFDDQQVLVAGHSNTVPRVLKALGLADIPTLAESDYDDLFIVNITSGGETSLLHLHYGAPNPK